MRVLLAHPPLTPAGEVTPHVGLTTLASWLQSRGHLVGIVDLDLEVRFSQRPHLDYGGFFERTMQDFAPDVVGVTSMYSNSLQAEELVRTAKRIDPAAMTVAGGSHFGALCAHSLRRIPELDYAIEGEAESAFAALLEGVPVSGIPRLHYRCDGELRRNAPGALMDLGDLPPMWVTLQETISLSRYVATIPPSNQTRMAYVEAGRGCPFRCSFCATAPFWEHRFRVKPIPRLVDEIRYLHEEYGYNRFILVHDLLTVNRTFVSAFCDAMVDSRLPVEWMANSRTDIRLDGLLPKMKAAGCWKLFHGVESAAPHLQASMDKHLPIDGVYDCIEALNAHGLAATTSFVLGFPTESEADLSATLAMGARLKLMGVETVQFHRLRHFPPSPLSRMPCEATFDLESLRIEYPFLEVPENDVNRIRADRDFFSGYWLTETPAASSWQLAQMEMFFHHMVAMAPITIAAMASLLGPRLVATFCETIASVGSIRRERLDWETGHLWENWLELSPILRGWIDGVTEPGDWQRRLLEGLHAYEGQRIAFVNRHPIEDAIAFGSSWVGLYSPVHLTAALDRLRTSTALDSDLLQDRIVVLSRKRDGSFAVYLVDASRHDELIAGNPQLIDVFDLN